MLQTPYRVASLSPNVDGNPPLVRSREIVNLAPASRKRKHSEIAIAVDNQAVNIYDLQKSALATAYSIPSYDRFTCSPCSIRVRQRKTKEVQRYTYAAIAGEKRRIAAWVEQGGNENGFNKIEEASIDEDEGASSIIHLDCISCSNSQEEQGIMFGLMAIRRDGNVTCHDHRLERQSPLWKYSLQDDFRRIGLERKVMIHLVSTTNFDDARQSVLVSRQDVLTRIESRDDKDETGIILLVVSGYLEGSKKRDLHLLVYATSLDPSTKLELLNSYRIPAQHSDSIKSAVYSFSPNNDVLCQRTKQSIIIYDLKGPVLQISSSVSLRDKSSEIDSFCLLSSESFATVANSQIDMTALPSCALIGHQNLDDQKTSDSQTRAPISLISHSTKLNHLVAIHGTSILAFPLEFHQREDNMDLTNSSTYRLIDTLGHGSIFEVTPTKHKSSADHHFGHCIYSTASESPWDMQTRLDELLENEDLVTFDLEMTEQLQALPTFGVATDNRRMMYLLQKVFELRSKTGLGQSHSGSFLAIRRFATSTQLIWPKQAMHLIISQGFLALGSLRVALSLSRNLFPQKDLPAYALIDALADVDRTHELLRSFVTDTPILGIEELARILRTLVSEPELHTNGRDVAMSDVSHTSALDLNREITVNLVLPRASHIPSQDLTKSLRKTCTQAHLHSLVDMIRVQIANKGWLSSYAQEHPSHLSTKVESPEPKINHLIHLLNSTIDAIGPSGWINSTGPISSDEKLLYMKAEMSAALEGIEEANYLRGVLSEVLLCGKEGLRAGQHIKRQKTLTNGEDEDGTTAMDIVKPISVSLNDPLDRALPLGARTRAARVPVTKVLAGGEVRVRSKRDIGRLKSRMVGKYSFERIIL